MENHRIIKIKQAWISYGSQLNVFKNKYAMNSLFDQQYVLANQGIASVFHTKIQNYSFAPIGSNHISE